jgi:hypothetical protein
MPASTITLSAQPDSTPPGFDAFPQVWGHQGWGNQGTTSVLKRLMAAVRARLANPTTQSSAAFEEADPFFPEGQLQRRIATLGFVMARG